MSEKRYGFVIDTDMCMGCNTCGVVCKMENNVPSGIIWNKVLADNGEQLFSPSGTYPAKGETSNLSMGFITIACQHCEAPACTEVCPTGATYKDEETGVVLQNYEVCIGCLSCMAACPYDVRSLNEQEPKYYMGHATGDSNVPQHLANTVEKCTMCWHRLEKGLEPECVVGCPAKARYFGDFNDPESEVSQLIATRSYKQLLPEAGTDPSVYYLV